MEDMDPGGGNHADRHQPGDAGRMPIA